MASGNQLVQQLANSLQKSVKVEVFDVEDSEEAEMGEPLDEGYGGGVSSWDASPHQPQSSAQSFAGLVGASMKAVAPAAKGGVRHTIDKLNDLGKCGSVPFGRGKDKVVKDSAALGLPAATEGETGI